MFSTPSIKHIVLLSLLILASASVAWAQANAKVSGTLSDPNGAAVPGAVVKLTNQATKIEADTTTVGAVSETVEIMAGTELIQQASSDLGTVILEKVVQDLPLNGRNFTQLLTQNLANIGRITTLAAGTNPRQIQFGLRLMF